MKPPPFELNERTPAARYKRPFHEMRRSLPEELKRRRKVLTCFLESIIVGAPLSYFDTILFTPNCCYKTRWKNDRNMIEVEWNSKCAEIIFCTGFEISFDDAVAL